MKLCLLLLMAASLLPAQTVEGDILDAVTGAPIVGARASTMIGATPEVATSDRAGHFRLTTTVAGYSFTVSMPGYLRVTRSYPVQTGKAPAPVSNLRIELTPQAVISGKLEDEDGFPVVNTRVEAMHYQLVDGERKLVPAIYNNQQSDDLGRYRISSLPAGKYFLRVTPNELAQWDSRYITQFHGGAFQPRDSDAIELKAGEERTVNFHLGKADGVTVSGRIEKTPGTLLSIRLSNDSIYLALRQISNDGTFTIQHVPPGTYTLQVRSGSGTVISDGELSADQQIKVESSDIRDLTISLHRVVAIDIAGQLKFESGVEPRPVRVMLQSSTGQSMSVQSNPDGSFVLKDVSPGRYRANIFALQPTNLAAITDVSEALRTVVYPTTVRFGSKEAQAQGFDVADKFRGPLEIGVGSALGSLKASVLNAKGQPAPGAMVLLQNLSQGRPTGAAADADGIANLPYVIPGDYRIYVVASMEDANLLNDPDWFAAHEKDNPPLHVVAGANPSVTVKLPSR